MGAMNWKCPGCEKTTPVNMEHPLVASGNWKLGTKAKQWCQNCHKNTTKVIVETMRPRSRQLTEALDLRQKALKVWNSYVKTGDLSSAEKSTLRQAYWKRVLPKHPDFSLAQWVEDNFPRMS